MGMWTSLPMTGDWGGQTAAVPKPQPHWPDTWPQWPQTKGPELSPLEFAVGLWSLGCGNRSFLRKILKICCQFKINLLLSAYAHESDKLAKRSVQMHQPVVNRALGKVSGLGCSWGSPPNLPMGENRLHRAGCGGKSKAEFCAILPWTGPSLCNVAFV